MLSLLPHAIVQDHFLIYFAVIHSWPAAMSSICIERVVCEGIALLPFALYDPVRPYVRICVTYLRYYSSLSVSHAVLSILSKGVYEHPSVEGIATGSLYIDETCCYSLSLVPLLLNFGEVRALPPPKLEGDGDTMSPDQHALGKCRNPFCLPEFVSGSHARGTREIVISGNSPRFLLLHIPPTDPPRRIYRPVDSAPRDFGTHRWMVF